MGSMMHTHPERKVPCEIFEPTLIAEVCIRTRWTDLHDPKEPQKVCHLLIDVMNMPSRNRSVYTWTVTEL